MKGQSKIVRKVMATACDRGIGNIRECHVHALDAMTHLDLVEIQKSGKLAGERIAEVIAIAKCSLDEAQETANILAAWLHGPSDEMLRRHGIRVKEIDDGMSIAEYDE